MKYIFYSFTFLFLAVLAQAQHHIDYVSFFPPAHIVQNEITLQQKDSDNKNELSFEEYFLDPTMHNHFDYHKKQGGLILGAADGARVVISTITITITQPNNYSGSLVQNFNVDHFIKLNAYGIVEGLSVGKASQEQEWFQEASSDSSFFLSSGKMKYILTPLPPVTSGVRNFNLYSSNIAVIKAIKIVDAGYTGAGNDAVCPSYNSIWGVTPRTFLPAMDDDDKLIWCNLRINNHESCGKYLVKYQGTAPCSSTSMAGCRETEKNR